MAKAQQERLETVGSGKNCGASSGRNSSRARRTFNVILVGEILQIQSQIVFWLSISERGVEACIAIDHRRFIIIDVAIVDIHHTTTDFPGAANEIRCP